MKIYIVEACWYDDICECNTSMIARVFASKESAQKYIDAFPEVNGAAGRRLDELMDKCGDKDGQAIYGDDEELMNAMKEYVYIYGVPDNEVDLRISEYELRD